MKNEEHNRINRVLTRLKMGIPGDIRVPYAGGFIYINEKDYKKILDLVDEYRDNLICEYIENMREES